MLYKETVSPVLLDLLKRLFSYREMDDFVLVGGTALSLKIGNRRSADIDLFTNRDFSGESLADFLKEHSFGFKQQSGFKGGLFGHIADIKIDFIRHAYPWIVKPDMAEGIRFASLEDIAAMKLNAITGNGTRLKDFVDIAYLSGYMTLSSMLDHYEKKYPDINGVMAVKSLCYFDDIDFAVDIDYMKAGMNWETIKTRILEMVRQPREQFSLL